MHRRWLIVFLALGVAIAAWFLVGSVQKRQFQKELLQAKSEFGRRQFGAARARLVQLAQRGRADGEVE
jgi:hypothetical protein